MKIIKVFIFDYQNLRALDMLTCVCSDLPIPGHG
jgi:hypothetical protein